VLLLETFGRKILSTNKFKSYEIRIMKYLEISEVMGNYCYICNAWIMAEYGIKDLSMQVSSWIEASMGHRSIHIGKAMV
jgi:hypothetical protein